VDFPTLNAPRKTTRYLPLLQLLDAPLQTRGFAAAIAFEIGVVEKAVQVIQRLESPLTISNVLFNAHDE
jgi:hypothetical protein